MTQAERIEIAMRMMSASQAALADLVEIKDAGAKERAMEFHRKALALAQAVIQSAPT